jgi:hypothetical protein
MTIRRNDGAPTRIPIPILFVPQIKDKRLTNGRRVTRFVHQALPPASSWSGEIEQVAQPESIDRSHEKEISSHFRMQNRGSPLGIGMHNLLVFN